MHNRATLTGPRESIALEEEGMQTTVPRTDEIFGSSYQHRMSQKVSASEVCQVLREFYCQIMWLSKPSNKPSDLSLHQQVTSYA